MATLYDYLKKPSYKYVVRSLLEFFKEDIEEIGRQFLMYGINEISEVSQIMPQEYTPGFASYPNHEVYVFTLDIQTPLTPPEIYEMICNTLLHSYSSIIVHGYDEPIESAYRYQAAVEHMDTEAEKDGLTPAPLSGNTFDMDVKQDMIDAMVGDNQKAAAVSGGYNGNNYTSHIEQNQSGLMAAAVSAQDSIEVTKPEEACKDYAFITKYTAPSRKSVDDVSRWYKDQEFKLVKRST
jgi:hypothetical protein